MQSDLLPAYALFGRLAGELGLSRGISIEIGLLILLAFFSGSEAAILAVNRFRARHDAEDKVKGAGAVMSLLARKEDFLPAILALQTLLTVTISTIGTALASAIHAGPESLFFSALIITVCVLIFGEILPKTFASQIPNRLSYRISAFLLIMTRFVSLFLRPLTWSLHHLVALLGHPPSHAIPTEKELKFLISLSREHGVLNEEEEELLQNIFDFTDAKVGEVMVPRTQIESVQEDAPFSQVKEKVVRTRYSRYPVYSTDLDHITGFLDVRDIITAEAKGKALSSLKEFIRPVTFVPESKRVGSLLHDMRKENFQVAIVVDEYGGTAGFVSLTDLVEEIVGKLPVEQPAASQEIHPVDERTLIVPASTRLDELEERLGISLGPMEVHTVGGLVFGLFGRVPEQGEQIRFQDLRFTVTEKDGYKISKVMVAKEPV